MTIDNIFRQIQDIVSAPTPPVIVLGSGASISYGIASMGSLATMLKDYLVRRVMSQNRLKNA